MRYITLLYIPDPALLKSHIKPSPNQWFTPQAGITLNGLFLHHKIWKFTLSQQLTKICKPYPTYSTCVRVKKGV